MNLFKDTVNQPVPPSEHLPVEVSSKRETPFHTTDETQQQLLSELLKELRTVDSFASSNAISQVASTTEQSFGFPIARLNTFINDGTDSIYLAFDDATTENIFSGVIEVKPGQPITNFPRSVNRLVVRAKTGVQAFRAWGVR